VIDFLKEPGRFTELGGKMPKAFSLSVLPGQARPSWPRPLPAKATFLFQHERFGVRRDVRGLGAAR